MKTKPNTEDALFEALVKGEINDKDYKERLLIKDFVEGTRVEALRNIDGVVMKGSKGTIVHLLTSDIGVEWDNKPNSGHACQNHAKNGYGWYVASRNIKIIES